MAIALSLIFPIRNAESTLAAQASQLLEVLAEMTPDFEVILVDDGSHDLTDEVALDLLREYPQLRLVRHGEPRGHQAAVETGLRLAAGEVILVHPSGAPVPANDLLRAWRSRNTLAPQVPTAAAYPRPISAGLLDRLRTWSTQAAGGAYGAKKPNAVAILRRWESDDAQLAESRTVVKIPVPRGEQQNGALQKNTANAGKNVLWEEDSLNW